jgi:hypothetical protein
MASSDSINKMRLAAAGLDERFHEDLFMRVHFRNVPSQVGDGPAITRVDPVAAV